MTEKSTEDAAVPKGRERTDRSLSTERAKTDASLSEERSHTERHADKAVLLSRVEADKLRSQVRLDSDDLCDAERAVQGDINSEDRHETDKRLLQERRIADEALDLERRHVDSVLESERWKKKAYERKLFQVEREETDENLTLERNLTDVEAQLASAAITTRDDFLAIVSHDLRNPLGSISLAADLLIESPIYATANDEDRQYLELIGRNADAALRLIGDLLDVERIASGRLSVELKDNSVGDIIRHLCTSLAPQAQAKKLSLKMDVPVDVSVDCDRYRISQVLSNLLGNAIKFTPAGGHIVVGAQLFDDEVQFTVADTGPGIPENMRITVFERLRQIGKQSRNGLGLGLYIAKMIVEAHKGRIWVEGEAGQGSTFRFTVPVCSKGSPLPS